jgi:hypothetical protein
MKAFKLIIIIFLLISSIFIFTTPVSADVGPKPTSTVEIIGIDEPYYFDLLVEHSFSVPILTDIEVLSQIEYDYYAEDYPNILNGYQDDDGFASYTLYTNMPHVIRQLENTNEFHVGYFSAPSVFKIVIVTESNNVYISEIINKTYFSAHFTYDFSNDTVIEEAANNSNNVYDNVGDVSEDFPYLSIIGVAVLGVVLTLIIELGVLYVFGYREKETYKIALFTNIGTQLILNLCIFFGFALWSIFGGIGILIIGEVLVFIIEIFVYQITFKERHIVKPIPYALLANLASLILGWYILSLIGSIFL